MAMTKAQKQKAYEDRVRKRLEPIDRIHATIHNSAVRGDPTAKFLLGEDKYETLLNVERHLSRLFPGP
jgi:hypothetical protein